MPSTKLRALQMGEETVWGTGVPATVKLMGITDVTFKPNPEVQQPEELGSLAPSTMATLAYYDVEGNVKGWLSYEDFPYYLEQLFGEVAPSGAGPYVRAYTAPLGTAVNPRFATFEYNQTGYVYDVTGVLMTTFQINIEPRGYWSFDANYMGKGMNVGTLAALTGRTVEPIRASDTVVYADAFGATIGTTALPTDLIKITLDIDTHRHLKDFIGATGPTDWGVDQWEGELTLQFELDATSKALLDALITPALVTRQFRIKATSGAKIAQVDFAGVMTNPDNFFDDRNGNQTVTLHFKGMVDLTGLGNWLKASVTNAVATQL